MRRLVDGVQSVLAEVTLGATDALADQSHRLELGEKIFGGTIDMKKAINLGAARLLFGHHQGVVARILGKIISDADRRHTGRQTRLIGNRIHPRAVEIDGGRVAP